MTVDSSSTAPVLEPGERGALARRRLGARSALAASAALLVALPFTLLLLAVLTRSEWLARIDDGAADTLHASAADNPALVDGLRAVSLATQPNLLRLLTVLLVLFWWRRGRRTVAVWFAVTMAVGGLLSVVVKEVVQRARPEIADAPAAGGYSFPSGHALNSMLFAACLVVILHPRLHGWARWLLHGAAAAFVLLVGYDRVALGVHYVSDVAAGWVVALAIVAGSLAAFSVHLRGPAPGPATVP